MSTYKQHSGVYTITNIITNKIYVGSATDSFKQRWSGHRNTLKKNKHANLYLQRSYNKHGIENFKYEILEECDPEFCVSTEQYWINMLNVCNRKFGYNIAPTAGNSYGQKRTKEQKLTMSIASKKKYENGFKGNTYGKKYTELEKLRITQARLKTGNMNNKPIYCFNIYGKHIATSIFVSQLSIFTNVDRADIRRILSNSQKYSKEYIFTFDPNSISKLIKNLYIRKERKYLYYGKVLFLETGEVFTFNKIQDFADKIGSKHSYAHNIIKGKKGLKKYKILEYGKI